MDDRILIGVIHLPRLPYTIYNPGYSVEGLVERAVEEARVLEDAGFDGVIVENYGDKPYRARVTDSLALAAMAIVVREVSRSTSLEVGVNLLRNSGLEAYSIAVAAGASFIRVNSLLETLVADTGILEPEAPRLAAVRANYPGIKVYADLSSKHASSLTLITLMEQADFTGADDPLAEALRELVLDTIERGGADAIIVTGARTGEPPSTRILSLVKKHSSVPILVGSGLTPSNAQELMKHADGAIVGSYIREGGVAGARISRERAERIVSAVKDWI